MLPSNTAWWWRVRGGFGYKNGFLGGGFIQRELEAYLKIYGSCNIDLFILLILAN